MRDKLRSLRDRIAALGPRVNIRPDASAEMQRRIQSVAGRVESTLRLVVTSAAKPVENLDEVVEDIVAEAHLLVHELDRILASPPRVLSSAREGGIERRRHERYDVNVAVRLLRHLASKRDTDGGVALSTETADRPAGNVSSGGIFVTLPAAELPLLGVGNVVHVEVVTSELRVYARAVVARRDASGVGLSWILEEDRARQDVNALLEAVRRGGAPRSVR